MQYKKKIGWNNTALSVIVFNMPYNSSVGEFNLNFKR